MTAGNLDAQRGRQPDGLDAKTLRQQEVALKKQETSKKVSELKERVEESGIIEKVTSAKDMFEGIITSLGSGVQTVLTLLKTMNGNKQPGWLQMALEYYANHPKTLLNVVAKVPGVQIDIEQEMASGTAEATMKSIEQTAKEAFPNDPKAVETLTKTLAANGPIISLKDLQEKSTALLVAKRAEKAKAVAAAPATTPNPNPQNAPAAGTQTASSAPAANPSTTPNSTPNPSTATTPPKTT